MAGKGERPLAMVRIGLELSFPGIELFPRRLTHEGANVGERHASLTERIDHLGVSQLAWRVVAIPRARVDRCRSEEALGRTSGAVWPRGRAV